MGTIREILRAFVGLFRWLIMLAPWEQAVRVRLGKRVKVLGAGVHLRIPFADVIYRQSIRRRASMCGTITVTTRDGKTITLSLALQYAIGDLRKLYETLHDAEDTIEMNAVGLAARYVAAHDFDSCLPSAIENEVRLRLHLENFGLMDVEVFITTFAVVRTYRIIQGEPREWKRGAGLLTTQSDAVTNQ